MHLVPFADILNHSTHRPAAHLSNDNDSLAAASGVFGPGCAPDGTMVMRATAAVKKGREVCNTYGELSNAQLLQRYGFVEEGNRHDTVRLSLGRTSVLWEGLDGPELRGRQWAARRLLRYSWGTGDVCLEADRAWHWLDVAMFEAVAAIPARLMLVVRLRLLQDLPALLKAVTEVDPQEAAELTEDILSDPPDAAEASAMLAVIAQREGAYPTPLDEAEEALSAAAPGSPRWAALTLRCSEGRILAALKGTVARLAAVPACWAPPVLTSRGGLDSATWP